LNSFKINEIFCVSASGITTERDELTIQFDQTSLYHIKETIQSASSAEFRSKYNLQKDGRDWTLLTAKNDLMNNNPKIIEVLYRPFDKRFTFYTGKSKGFHSYPRSQVMNHIADKQNISMIIGRQGQAIGDGEWNIIHISNRCVDSNIFYRGRGTVFPIYIYQLNFEQQSNEQSPERTPNLNDPIDILDYMYAVLHSPTYREKYKEFLKIDFPRVPYPKDQDTFWQLVDLGSQMRQIHLLESPRIEKYITQYPIDGDNVVTKPKFQDSKVYINETQYFNFVPLMVWGFSIGGYQPAQKWLKDRKGKVLEFEDIQHYQKIIVALSETIRIMEEIDKISVE